MTDFFAAELRPKGRGRPQRILLGNWPDDHVRQVIRAVVFRDGTIPSYSHAGMPVANARTGTSPHRPTSALSSCNFGSSPPRAPPPTPSSSGDRNPAPLSPLPSSSSTNNNIFATHLKNLSDHFAKNSNGIFDSLPFKAFMSEALHHQNSPSFRRSMDFEDAEEPSMDFIRRRGSLTPPPRPPLDLEMPRLIPSNGIQKHDDTRSHSNDETLNEDPMNLVETSWEISSLNEGDSARKTPNGPTQHAIRNA